jgi:hypothetical protein
VTRNIPAACSSPGCALWRGHSLQHMTRTEVIELSKEADRLRAEVKLLRAAAEPEARPVSVKVYAQHDFARPGKLCRNCGCDWFDQSGLCQVPRPVLP